jgi:hypothetical protein
VDVEPAFAYIIEGGLDDLGQTPNPTLLSGGVANLADACRLSLLKFVNSHCFAAGYVEDPVLL